jgi:hypothetical protein
MGAVQKSQTTSPWECWLQLQSTRMALQTKIVVAETFTHLRHCLAEIETEMTARALRLSTFPEEANDMKDVLEELLLVMQRTRHYPGS